MTNPIVSCSIGGSRRDTLHIDSSASGAMSANSAAAVKAMIAETGAAFVMFNFGNFPRQAIAVDAPKLDSYIERLFAQPSTCNRSRPVANNAVDFSDLEGIIDHL